MAADPYAPWSRWDAPGFQYVATNTQPSVVVPRLLDFGQPIPGQAPFIQRDPGLPPVLPPGQNFLRTTLLDQRVNSLDPSFYDCVYGLANSAQTVIEQCYKDIGCCSSTCCHNSAWHDKYSWAVALFIIFLSLVLIAMAITLCCWLFNRAADKNQKKDLLTSAGLSPAPSQLSLVAPVPPPAVTYPYGSPGGYRY